MDGEHRGLRSYACDRVRWLELTAFFDRKGITLRFDVDVPTETFGVDRGRCAVLVPDGKGGCDERVAPPVGQTNRQAMMPRQRHPFPKIRLSGNMLRSLGRNRLGQCFSSRVILASVCPFSLVTLPIPGTRSLASASATHRQRKPLNFAGQTTSTKSV